VGASQPHQALELRPAVPTPAMLPLPGAAVAYPMATDNVTGPLGSRLSSVNQPVLSTRNTFSIPRLHPVDPHLSTPPPRTSTSINRLRFLDPLGLRPRVVYSKSADYSSAPKPE